MTTGKAFPLLTLIALVLATGCASIEFTRDTGSNKKPPEGIRYYDLSPYLIVHSNPDGTLNVRFEYLPDPNKKMSVLPKAKGANLETTLEFERGALKKADTAADATVIPKAIIEAAKSVLPLALDAGERKPGAESKSQPFPGPRIFKVVVRGGETLLIGGDATKPFRITLVPEKPAAPAAGGTP